MNLCKRIARGEAKDLFQETFTYLLELPQEKLQALHDKDELSPYIFRAITVMWFSSNSLFNRKYNTRYDNHQEIYDAVHNTEPYNHESDKIIEKYLTVINSDVSWFEGAERKDFAVFLFDEYLEEGSARKLAESLGVNYQTIVRMINHIKKRFHEHLN